MKILLAFIASFILIGSSIKTSKAQPFVDVASIQLNNFKGVNYNESNEQMLSKQLNAKLFLPLELKSGNVFILGSSMSKYKIGNSENNDISTNLTGVLLNIGGIKKWNVGKSSFMFLALPKICSDFVDVKTSHIQMGAVGLFAFQKRENLKIKAGLYYNREFFGNLFIPLLGMEWKPNDRLNIYGLLPNSVNIEYKVSSKIYAGCSFNSVKSSYRISGEEDYYVREGDRFFGHWQSKAFVNMQAAKNVVLFAEMGRTHGRAFEYYKNGSENLQTPLANNTFMLADDGLFANIGMAYRVRL